MARFWQKGTRGVTRTLIGVALVALVTAVTLAACGGDDGASPTATSDPNAQSGGRQTLSPLTAGRDVLAPDGRYSLRIPADWIRVDDPLAELAFRSTTTEPQLYMNVVREDLNGVDRAQAYAESARRRVGTIYANVVSISLAPVKIGDIDAYRWVYSATAGERERLFYQLYIVDGGQGFVITGLAPPDADLQSTQRTFDSVAGTLTFARG
jgi:hypothetical protein